MKRDHFLTCKGDSECKGPPLPFGRLRMQGSPFQIVPPLISHGMICDYIVWIDRDHTLLYRNEKRSFHDMLRTTQNARVPPCNLGDSESEAPPFQFGPPLTSHEMICNYIVWIDRDHTLLSRVEKRSFHEMLKGDSECKGPPLQFVPPLKFNGMICDYIVWIDRDLHSYIEMKEIIS